MTTYNNAPGSTDARTANQSLLDYNTATATNAAAKINSFGSTMSAAQLAATQQQYATAVKQATSIAAQLGVAYSPPEVKSKALINGTVPNAGTSMSLTSSNDKLMTVDGYGKTLAQNLTNVSSAVSSAVNLAKQWLTATSLPGVSSLSAINPASTATPPTTTNNANILSDAFNKPVAQVKGMSPATLNSASTTLNSTSSGTHDTVTNVNGQVLPASLGAYVPAINSLVDSFNSIRTIQEQAVPRMRNLEAEFSMRVTLASMAAELGMTGLAALIRAGDTTGNDSGYHMALIDQFQTALSNGNLNIISDMISQLGVTTVLTRYPTAISQILSSYRFPNGTTADQYPACKAALVDVLSSINANWDMSDAVPGAYNMEIFVGASTSTVTAFSTDNTYYRLIMAGSHYAQYASMGLTDVVKEMYPFAAI